MRKLNTYVLVHDHPAGLAITDAITIDGNRRKPITLKVAGDSIDLTKVDIDTYCKSAWCGTIRNLFLSGVIASDQQEVSNDRGALFDAAYGVLQENGGNTSGIAGAPRVIQIAPGLQVGVMNVEDINDKLPSIPTIPAVVEATMELEPGVMAPGRNMPGSEPVQQATKTKKSKKKKGKKEPGAGATNNKDYSDWKFNMDFQSQKTKIAESTDKDFLTWVIENDDSRQLQKIATARLVELGNQEQ